MPFIPNTPESMMGRTDSMNPESTCRGVTSNGRPCRRPLNGGSPPSQKPPVPARTKKNSQLRVDDPSDPNLYCWQHKEQASHSAMSSPGPRKSTTPILESRPSLDVVMGRLGIKDEEEKKRRGRERKKKQQSVGEKEKITQQTTGTSDVAPRPSRRTTTKQSSFCCCFTLPSLMEEEEKPSRPQPRPVQSVPEKAPTSKLPSKQHAALSRPSAAAGPKPASDKSSLSQTSQYLSLIPPTASPQTASQLMAELAKPISKQDEAGYIYIFWLTPESEPSTPPAEAARSLLAPPETAKSGQRQTSDVLQSYAGKTSAPGSKTMLLKIGRASNVQRRLNEWKRQCGYNLSLIRYYPHISSGEPAVPRKMPHSHKVERLVHIELDGSGLRVRDQGNCKACGKAHKEWFEIEASRKGIEMVDEIVKRWSDWDERMGASAPTV